MFSPDTSRRLFRFGPFELNSQTGELLKNGIRLRLPDQSCRVLLALVERPGELVSREELRRQLWTDDTYVDFDHGLNLAVARVRQVLCDTVERPRYVETLPRKGYRFLGKVEIVNNSQAPDIRASAQPNNALMQAANHDPIPVARIAPRRPLSLLAVTGLIIPAADVYGRVLLGLAAGVLISVAAVTAYVVTSRQAETRVFHSVPLTSFRGHEMNPALSPDGQSVAFTWNGEKQNNFDIYVMRLGSNALVRLTSDLADDISPAWSPDGSTIAFVRRLGGERGELRLIPANGGPEHVIRKILNRRLNDASSTFISLSWSPDGRWIAASDRRPQDSSERIYLFSMTGDSRPLTSSPGYSGDHTPAFSPDGRKLAFSRLAGWSTSDIFELPLSASYSPVGQVRRLTEPGRWCVHPAWLPNGRVLYLAAREPGAPHELRTAGYSFGKANVLRLDNGPSEFTLHGDHLVYTHLKKDTNIWRVRIPGSVEAPSVPELFIASTWRDEKPRFSPDGQRVAFASLRSGSEEIWIARADGSSPVRVTSFGGSVVGYPAWSPDGQWLVFHARPEGQADVFAIPAAGGPLKRLTSHPADDVMPTYSPDGRWINFCSNRSGKPEIWRMPAAGGEPFQMTSSGGMQPFESADGKIFYLSGDGTTIRSVSVEGGPPSDVVGPLHPWPCGFAISRQGLYYAAPPHSGDLSFIRFFSFATREDRPVALANHGFYYGMTVTPDEKYIAFDQFDEFDHDLMLVENFRP